MDQSKIQLYDNQPIRTAWDEEHEEWYGSMKNAVSVWTSKKCSVLKWGQLKSG
jgi:hypothetical protein